MSAIAIISSMPIHAHFHLLAAHWQFKELQVKGIVR